MATRGNRNTTGASADFIEGRIRGIRINIPGDGYLTKITANISNFTVNVKATGAVHLDVSGSVGGRIASTDEATITANGLFDMTFATPVLLDGPGDFWILWGAEDVAGDIFSSYATLGNASNRIDLVEGRSSCNSTTAYSSPLAEISSGASNMNYENFKRDNIIATFDQRFAAEGRLAASGRLAAVGRLAASGRLTVT